MDYRTAYSQWLELFKHDEETLSELLSIRDSEEEIKDRFYTDLSFGTAGMRGILGAGTNRMNRYTVRRAAQGLCDYIKSTGSSEPVAIGYDSRRMSREFALEAALVLAGNGVKALLFDALRPVALLSFAVRQLKCIAGIVITASHNPKEYNGFKAYWRDGGQLPPEQAQAVLACMNKVSYGCARPMQERQALESGLLARIGPEIDEAYYAMVLKLSVRPDICREHGGDISIVYTPLNGSGAVPVTQVLKRAGFSRVFTVPEQTPPDPDFATVGVPNPENKKAFDLALRLADGICADLVFATDPDCDRVGVAAKSTQGDYVLLTGNQIGCLLAHYILSNLKANGRLPQNGAIIKSIVSTELARVIASSFGVLTADVLTGFKFIAEKIQEFEDSGSHSFLFGFEESFGYLSGSSVRDKDGVNAALLLAECALMHKLAGRTLYEGLLALYSEYGWALEDTLSFTAPGADGQACMARAMARLRENPPKEIGGVKVLETRDYLKDIPGFTKSDVLYYKLAGGCWVCVRPSGTEPKIKLYVNSMAAREDTARALLGALLADAKQIMEGVLGL